MRALVSFVVPHLVQAELSAGFAATMEESVDGRLDWQELETSAAAGFAGSAGGASAARVAQSVRFAKETWPLLHLLLPHLGQAVAWGGVDAGQQLARGDHLSVRGLLLTAGLAGAGSALGCAGTGSTAAGRTCTGATCAGSVDAGDGGKDERWRQRRHHAARRSISGR